MPSKRASLFIKRIRSRATWEENALSRQVLAKLGPACSACRENLRAGSPILFSGPSGTGKTMAAEILANDLRLDLYRIGLQAIVSKYIYETEKNLAEVFKAAERGDPILLFDEGDALFGKRSGVKDAHDRYANPETRLLLRRMESYGGICILAGNFGRYIDAAFLRRFRHHVRFDGSGTKERRADENKAR